MNTTLDELQAAVLALPNPERARLTVRILDSLQRSPEVEAAWVAEVRDRVAAFRRGGIEQGEVKSPRCDFCGKSRDTVARLISGPSVHICNECVELCNNVLSEEPSKQ
jgi:hypothetical protein